MSEHARTHFAAQAEASGVPLPDTLNGEAHAYISDPPARIPIHALDSLRIQPQLDPVRQWCRKHIGNVAAYLGQQAIIRHPTMARDYKRAREDNPARVAKNMFNFLLSRKSLSAGYLEDIQLEVVMPEDLSRGIVQHFQYVENIRPTTTVPENSAYVLTSAQLHAGRSLGRVGFVAYVNVQISQAHDREPVLNLPAAIATRRLSTNEMLAHSALWQSRAIRQVADGVNLRNPWQGGAPGSGSRS